MSESRFDPAEYLETEADIAVFLEEASQDGDAATIALALGVVARARNMSQLARDTGLTRPGLYKALAENGNPGFETIAKVARAMGYTLALRPIAPLS